MAVAQLLVFLVVPGLLLRFKAGLKGWLSPVVLCYALGVLGGNLGIPLRAEVTEAAVTAAVLLGIPLLVFAADLMRWLRLARTTALSCALSFLSVGLVALLTALPFARRVDEGWIVAGMLVGTYTGSAPNMAAVGVALGAAPETLVLVTTADLLAAGLFCFVLLSPAVALWGKVLPAFSGGRAAEEVAPPSGEPTLSWWASGAASLSLALVLVGLSCGAALLVPEAYQQLTAILGATTLGALASLSPRVRSLRTSYPLGEYFILVFCLGFGTLADVEKLLSSSSSGPLLLWTSAVLLGSVALHLLLCRLAKVDRDTAVITLTAAIYGPPMIGPVATNLKNRELVLSGLTAALVGLAAGNYLGVAVALAVRGAPG